MDLGKGNRKLSQLSLTVPSRIKGTNVFDFWNGDKYEGEYVCMKQPLLVFREGKGTYWSYDQSVYNGVWVKDSLDKANDIIFPDKSRFTGKLNNMIMEGFGAYKFREVDIHGFLVDNRFFGEVKLTDPTGHVWVALNSNNEDELYFVPLQPFWKSIQNRSPVVYAEGEDMNSDQ